MTKELFQMALNITVPWYIEKVSELLVKEL
jgi:hypothetical protein